MDFSVSIFVKYCVNPMELKEYLATLSKENLISLLMDLSDTNVEVRNYLTEKQNNGQPESEQQEIILPLQ